LQSLGTQLPAGEEQAFKRCSHIAASIASPTSSASPQWMQKIHYILIQWPSAKLVGVAADLLRKSMPSPTIHLAVGERRGYFLLPSHQCRKHTENKSSAALKNTRSCYSHLMFKTNSRR